MALFAAAMLPCWGCGLAPHSFRKLQPPAATVRARSVGGDPRTADPNVVPALVGRLEDDDPVVRLAAGEELRKRTGQDFGFVAWASPEERSAAIARWRSWMKAPPMPADPIPATELPPLPAETSQVTRRAARRRRVKAQVPPATPAAPTTSENAAS
jgi:hypothetical protein